jgi:predicted DnaQ family exonuclease/DinG family helicase
VLEWGAPVLRWSLRRLFGAHPSRTVGVVTESFNMRLLRVHPLDSPVVALAMDVEGAGTDGAKLSRVAGVKFHAGQVIDTFEAAPRALIPALPAFVGDAPVTGYELSDVAALLAGSSIALGESWWDIGELASLVLPGGGSATLEALARQLDIDLPLDLPVAFRAVIAQQVYEALVARVRAQPVAVMRRQADLLSRARSPLGELLSALAEAPTTNEQGPITGIDQREIAARLERRRPIGAPAKAQQMIDPDEMTRMLAGDGVLAKGFPRYQPRLEQIAMARAVAQALGAPSNYGEGNHLVVEGGTGIGKSVAYLLPAILFAARNNVRVVVSTNTINLQEQLIAKDIPALIDVLRDVPGVDLTNFNYTYLKGKANYLCLRRWEALANSDLLTPDDAKTMSKTLGWLRHTRTGDRAELSLQGSDLGTWDRMSASGFGTCGGAREGACFYRHARDDANGAQLLVVNHALLLSNMQVDGTVLPDFDYLIIDEAHNLEEAATRQFGFRVAQTTGEELVERLGNVVHSLGNVLKVTPLDEQKKADAQLRMTEAQAPLFDVRDRWAKLMVDLAAFGKSQQESNDDGEVRITPGLRIQPAWSEIEIAWDDFERGSADAASRADALLRLMDNLPSEMVPGLEDLKNNLGDWSTDQAELRARVSGFVSNPDAQMVYWLGRSGGPLSMNGAPLEVSSRLSEELFYAKKSVILTSATLAVRGDFKHVRERLGAEESEELALGSPFDYKRAALLALPTDVPEPNRPGYADAVAEIIAGLALEAGGRTLALFTSHAGVRGTATALRRRLPAKGIPVLAQGVDGSPQQLLARFQENPKSVLLGTASFWEGVDIANNAMKVLVVARLPFNVPTEPVFAARSGLYDSPFMQYAVPQAVLRFRQGFGRLIRNKDDHGAVIVLDSRITSKPYGKAFLESVPPATVLRAPLAQVLAGVGEWLRAGTLADPPADVTP